MTQTANTATRKCNHCSKVYRVRRGEGGGQARRGETPETFPFDPATGTGIRTQNPDWMHGAHCSGRCYDAAYYEPS